MQYATKILWAMATTALLYPRRALVGKFVSQVSAFGSGRRVGGLHQSALQIHMPLGMRLLLRLPRTRCSRANSCARSQLRNISEHAQMFGAGGI